MPFYIFNLENTDIIEEIFFKMSDAPKVGSKIEYDGNLYIRLASIPNASSNSIEGCPFDKKSFLRATEKNGGTFGKMFDLSKEYSDKRAEKEGVDPIKKKFEDSSREKTGIKPIENTKKDFSKNEVLKRMGVSVKERKQSRNK